MEVEGLEGYDFVGFEYILSFSLGGFLFFFKEFFQMEMKRRVV